jgi:hypothetical protein
MVQNTRRNFSPACALSFTQRMEQAAINELFFRFDYDDLGMTEMMTNRERPTIGREHPTSQ